MSELLRTRHTTTYDLLADEYEARVESLRDVTQASLEVFNTYLAPKSRILDIGCGAGLCVEILQSMGHHTEGIELAPKMAQKASVRNPDSAIHIGDYEHYQTSDPYDGLVAFAFIHLFPKRHALEVLHKMHRDMALGAVMLIGTTASDASYEGWEVKSDYVQQSYRYRKHWTTAEFEEALKDTNFTVVHMQPHEDTYGKTWLDYVVKPMGK